MRSLIRKLVSRGSGRSKTHPGTAHTRDTDRAWEIKAIRTVQAKFSRMPVDQIARMLFASRLQPLAALLEECGWRSPYKMRHYFISLAMQTPVPKRPRVLSTKDWIPAAATIGEVIAAYAVRLADFDENSWLASRVFNDRVLNPRFIDMEQVREICRRFFAQMSSSENDIGLPLEIVMEMFDHFEKVIEQQLDDLRQGRGPPLNRGQDPLLHTAGAIVLRIPELGSRFGDKNMAILLKIFGLIRRQRDDRLFIADEIGHPALTEQKPLIVAEDHVYVGDLNALWLALYDRLLLASREAEWSRRRGEYVEDKTADILRKLFGVGAVHQHVWERRGGPEHDAIVVIDDALVVVESKGAAAVPPITFDHALNLQRIQAHAETSKSPFYGIKQAQKLLRKLMASSKPVTVRVGSRKWEEAVPLELDPRIFKRYFAIAVSLEEYGSLLTDWSTLKIVDTSFGSPWGVDLHAFEQFAWGIERRGWDGRDLLVYLQDRLLCHGGMITGDELDYAGYWLTQGDLIPFSHPGMSFQGRNWAQIFDELWLERRGLARVEFASVPRPSTAPERDRAAAMRDFIDRIIP